MELYLPIAEISVNALTLLALGAAVGFLSGLFGVGGGFMMTPLLIFLGVPPAVAVSTQANQLVGASVSGVLGHWQRGNVDVRLGLVLLAGSLLGSGLGVWLFAWLQRVGQVDLVISLLYVGLLGFVGLSMLIEAGLALLRRNRTAKARVKFYQLPWLKRLPLRMDFPRSQLTLSALLPGAIGLVGGLLVALMGTGGGFLLVPAMIYLLGMPTALVAGTSLFQMIFTTAATTVLQALTSHTVDVMLALILLLGGVVGAQLGARYSHRLRGEVVRVLLALMVVAVAGKLGADLLKPPEEPFSIDLVGGR